MALCWVGVMVLGVLLAAVAAAASGRKRWTRTLPVEVTLLGAAAVLLAGLSG